MRRLVGGKSLQLPQGHDRHRTLLADTALGALSVLVGQRQLATGSQRDQREIKTPCSFLVIVLFIIFVIIIFFVIVRLTDRVMRHMALIVP